MARKRSDLVDDPPVDRESATTRERRNFEQPPRSRWIAERQIHPRNRSKRTAKPNRDPESVGPTDPLDQPNLAALRLAEHPSQDAFCEVSYAHLASILGPRLQATLVSSPLCYCRRLPAKRFVAHTSSAQIVHARHIVVL